MTRAKDPKRDDLQQDRTVGIADERERVQQARDSVQDAIGKIIGEPLGENVGENPDDNTDSPAKDETRKPVSPPAVKRDHPIDNDGAD